jgi:tRNA 2-thiouridine synthesizing protein E
VELNMETRVHVPEAPKPQDHSLTALHARLDLLSEQMAFLVERQRKTEELFEEMTPILKAVMGSATERLHGMEQKGYFEFGREAVGIAERIMDGFSPEDVRQLGGAIVSILETVRELTQPEVLKVAAEASTVLQNADKAEPIGIVGMVRATGDHDVQKGMSVMVEVMRNVGRAATVVREKRAASPASQKKARLEAILGPRRGTTAGKALGVERTPPPAVARAVQVKRSEAIAGKSTGPACATPTTGPAPVTATIDGVGFGADGHLSDASAWTRALGEKLAAMQGVEMSDAHWKLVEVARADFEATKTSPNIRRLTQVGGVSTKDIYALFPKAPARTLAKIAGLPKPAGCL